MERKHLLLAYTCPMAASKEVEIKFLVNDLKTVMRKLRQLGFRCVTRRAHESNVLWDLPGRPLRRRGEILRLRRYAGHWTLTHKSRGSSGRHKTRVENETAVENGSSMSNVLRALGFGPSFVYEKFRSQWTDGQGNVVVDETPIGHVAEIEGPPRWIDRTAKQLGVARKSYIT
ncbi:MAG TPA: class IV adenylate cyclase, partial [Longimicrobiales bacterium]|nr:class IV adenylate cyclase [Longimicrobiales bacterium]